MKSPSVRRAYLALTVALAAFAPVTYAATFPYFSPATGILKGNAASYVTTAATSADVIGLWTGTCDMATFLSGAGACSSTLSGLNPTFTIHDTGSGNDRVRVVSDGGVLVGDPTGGSQGAGSINAASLYINGDPVGTSSGAVSSVGLAAPSVFSVSGSPVTAAGTLTLGFAGSQTANRVLATPDSTTGALSLRALVAGDLPAISLTAGVSGTLPVANGGTGQTALSALTANPTATVGLAAVNGSASTFLRSDGAPALSQSITPTWSALHTFSTAPALYPTTALETAAGATTVKQYAYGDPRRASFYTSDGWIDYGDAPTFVDGSHLTIAGNVVARYPALSRLMIIGNTGAKANVLIRAAPTFSAGATTVNFTNDTGASIPTTQAAVWTQQTLTANSPTSVVFDLNGPFGMMVNNLSTGSLSSARYAAFTSDASGLADSAMSMVAVSPNYSGAYLGGGFTSGARAVLYTPPSGSLEIGTSDQARIKIPSDATAIEFKSALSFPDGTVSLPSQTFASATNAGRFWSGTELRDVTAGSPRWIIGDTYVINRVQHLGLAGTANAPADSFEADPDTGSYRVGTNSWGVATDGANRFTVTSGVQVGAPTGGDQGVGTLNATGLFVNGNAVVSQATTTATGTATGCTTAPTGTLRFVKTGNMATLSSDGIVGCTSNSTALTYTGAIPAGYQPARTQQCATVVVDNGVLVSGRAILNASSSVLTLRVTSTSGDFANTGTKGWDVTGAVCSYILN